MIDGWLLDVHSDHAGQQMLAWLIDIDGVAHRCSVPWHPTLHVHGSARDLEQLLYWLQQPEIQQRFSIGGMRQKKARLALDTYEIHQVLEIDVLLHHRLKGLAQHIEARGNFHRFSLFSVDAHVAQRFLHEHDCVLFQYVRWDGEHLHSLEMMSENGENFPPFHIIRLSADFKHPKGFISHDDEPMRLEFESIQQEGFAPSPSFTMSREIHRSECESARSFLVKFQSIMNELDPDIVLTQGGDRHLFPALLSMAKQTNAPLHLGRTSDSLSVSKAAQTVHSYGQTLHRPASYLLQGRLHLDLNNSFIVREGGIVGLFELARHSRQSAQEISRLSPGSVISAIQMRVALDDGVLVPWKKNRPEDTKTALELLHADRGGLYLDSQPGLHGPVIELDFASLFPSIIASRNISPETLNCACCQPPRTGDSSGFVPLHPEVAEQEFRHRQLAEHLGSGLFPQTQSKALQVPGLNTHTCARTQGFLGRVVAPLIERRRQLKQLRRRPGDPYDLRQNALKWLLVTCFGYTGYRNARFGRIEAHEAICAWARDILLTTIELAHQSGWDVLHAIVDCVWLSDRLGRTAPEQHAAALEFAEQVSQIVGIPLEFEDIYTFIAFLPSRMHGAGSLTKYWGLGQNGFKIRGIEMRQHSSPPWIRNLQQTALTILAKESEINDRNIPSTRAQWDVLSWYRSEIHRLKKGELNLSEAILTRRVTKPLTDYRVKNLTYAALERARRRGYLVLPGTKIRYVVIDILASVSYDRVVLSEEIETSESSLGQPCIQHYRSLALRAIWAILAPFGWTETSIQSAGLQRSLLEFNPEFV